MIMSKWTFRSCFLVGTVIRIVASLFDLFLITRTNIKIGIPDKVAFIFGDAFILEIASMMFFLPAVVLTSKVCPKGYEATTYAVLAGFQNFGQASAKSIGIYLISGLGIETDPNAPGGCNVEVFFFFFV